MLFPLRSTLRNLSESDDELLNARRAFREDPSNELNRLKLLAVKRRVGLVDDDRMERLYKNASARYKARNKIFLRSPDTLKSIPLTGSHGSSTIALKRFRARILKDHPDAETRPEKLNQALNHFNAAIASNRRAMQIMRNIKRLELQRQEPLDDTSDYMKDYNKHLADAELHFNHAISAKADHLLNPGAYSQ
jgi:hypothetical protein